MKKMILTTLSIIALCTVINYTAVSAKSEPPILSANRTYILREYNGVIACFEENVDEPFLITEVIVRYLPPKDRSMLKSGIKIIGSRALSRALEDYRT